MENIVEIDHLSKAFGKQVVLQDVSVRFAKGLIHGVVGRNGSGKTVLFKCILGLMPFTQGEIRVRSLRVGQDIDVPKDVGMLIEAPGFLPNYSGYGNLRILARISHKANKAQIIQAIESVGLEPKSRKWVLKYSMGMRQRLGIAQAIMEDPDLLILDEPMNGLDNAGVKDMRALLLALKAQGKTILLATHSKEDIAALCDRVYEIDAGRLTQVPDPHNNAP